MAPSFLYAQHGHNLGGGSPLGSRPVQPKRSAPHELPAVYQQMQRWLEAG